MKKKVIVGMSGGVDSSLAAALLVQQGYDVIGVTLKLYSYEESLQEVTAGKKDCHPDAFIQNAKEVSRHLGIPHYVVNQEELFKEKVVNPFVSEYQKGRTPLPCARCNREVKTASLWNVLDEFQADYLATGHYVRSIQEEAHRELHRGLDPIRDQSFFLFMLTWNQLQKHLFPLGEFSKDQTRTMAQALGLVTAQTSASQDLCFIAKKTYQSWMAQEGSTGQPGDIIDQAGHVLGQHKGLSYYTVGQRQGIGVGGTQEPLYVVKLQVDQNQLVVGPKSALARTQILLHEVNWLAPDQQNVFDPNVQHHIGVKIRSSGAVKSAILKLSAGMQSAMVQLVEPEYGVAQGQACVFYQGQRLLGGGWIEQAAA